MAIGLKDATAPFPSSAKSVTEQHSPQEVIDFTPPANSGAAQALNFPIAQQRQTAREVTVTALERSDARDKLREMVMDISTIRLTESEINRMIAGAKVALNGQPCFSGSAGNLFRASKPAANSLAPLDRWQKPCRGMMSAQEAGDQTFLCDTQPYGFLTA